MKDNTGQVLVQAPVEIANYLLNEKRGALREIEGRHDAPIVIVADEQLHTPHYEVTRIRENELGEESNKPSYQRGTPRKLATIALTKANLNVPAAPAVKNVKPTQPAPLREPRPEPVQAVATAPAPAPAFTARAASPGFMGWLRGLFGGAEAAPQPRTPEPRERSDRGERNDRGGQRRDDRGNRQGGRESRDNRGKRDERRGQQQQQKQQQPGSPRREDGGKPAQPQQQQKQPQQKPEKQKQEAQARPQQDPGRQQQQPPRESRKARGETAPPARDADAIEPVVALVPATTVPVADPAADAAQAIAGADKAVNASEPATEGGNTESGGRRRRGRRGGRRRRNKQGAEGAAAGGAEPMDDEDAIDLSLHSQPEFDFADTSLAMPSVVPTTKGPLEVTDADGPARDSASSAPAAREAAIVASDSPVAVQAPAPVASEVVVEPPAPVANEVVIEPPASVANEVVVEAPTPVANEALAAPTPEAVGTPVMDEASIEPAVVAVETPAPEAVDAAAVEADGPADAAGEIAKASNAEAEADARANAVDEIAPVSKARAGDETSDSREETPQA
jgi:ribonuclease E